jgi:hypothetical protein
MIRWSDRLESIIMNEILYILNAIIAKSFLALIIFQKIEQKDLGLMVDVKNVINYIDVQDIQII